MGLLINNIMAPQTRSQTRQYNVVKTENNDSENSTMSSYSTHSNNYLTWIWYAMLMLVMIGLSIWAIIEVANTFECKPILNCIDYAKQYVNANDTLWNNYYNLTFSQFGN